MESFENTAVNLGSFRNSLVEGDARLNSQLGSLIQPGSMTETPNDIGAALKWGDENSIEEDDGIPQVDVYIENMEEESFKN